MMPINPLDWTAAPFLILYVSLVAIALLASLRACYVFQPDATMPAASELTAPELALLVGGRERAADTILVALLETGVAYLERNGQLTIDGLAAARLIDPYPAAATGTISRRTFHRAIEPAIMALRDRLAARGLVLSADEVSRQRREIFLLLSGVVAFGFAKIVVGSARGHPVGILVTLVIVTTIVGLVMIAATIFRTHAGRILVKESRSVYARAARAPLGQELALAFALTGAAVLAGTPYAAYASQLSTSGSGGCGGGGSGCGGGGGGGCGGCGG